MRTLRSLPYARIGIVLIGLVLAVAIRLSLIDYKSSDFFDYTKVWYNTLKSLGFAAFGQDFSNYNLPYLYLLYAVIRLFPNVPAPIAVKIPAIVADFVSAWFVYRIVGLKFQSWVLPTLAAFAALFAPTVVLNSAFWGQADSLYTCALLATLYFVLRRSGALAFLAFGIAVSFKAQAVFLGPVLLAMLMRKELRWTDLALAPVVMVLSIMPAWIAGRPLLDLLLIYPNQAEQYQMLSMHAPSAYALMPDNSMTYQYFYVVGLLVTILAACVLVILIQHGPAKLSPRVLVAASLAAVLLMPFLLPKMHERYFYPADVISIVFAVFYPAYFYVAIAMISISFLAYQPYLFNVELVPMPFLALGVLAVTSVVVWILLRDLYGPQATPNAEEPIPDALEPDPTGLK